MTAESGRPDLRRFTRRHFLRIAGPGLLAAPALGLAPRPARADPETLDRELWRLIGRREPKPGRIELHLPPLAEDGALVPLTVRATSPMTGRDHVRAIHVLAEANPWPTIASFRFTPRGGRAEVRTRIRLARTQDVYAYADLSDDSVHLAVVHVEVTIGGCDA